MNVLVVKILTGARLSISEKKPDQGEAGQVSDST